MFKNARFLLVNLLFLLLIGPAHGQTYKIRTIVIDAGHGGVKPGAQGSRAYEKDITLQVALKLGKKLQAEFPNIRIIQTRKTDVDVDWYKRAGIANDAKADLFISIHCNSMPNKDKKTRGTETFVGAYRRINEMDKGLKENEEILNDKNYNKTKAYDPTDPQELILLSLYKSLYRAKSLVLAKLIQKNYTEVNKRVNRGVKEQGLLILQRAALPSVLTEIGFISNVEEENYMLSDEGQEEITSAIINAIKQYKKEVEN
ncbi:MAG: N-acetylmuramoyl-L-alanine amidase [Pedobacter sp.]|nr:N-acetylmuramoyl-L-alanine amidase [Pedobacter sp.]MDQ8051806.1 N-acetylmuramoyl-L-alanine amidase [Pedobacter sp.]